MDAAGNGHCGGVGAKIVVVHGGRRTIPLGAWIIGIAHQFSFLVSTLMMDGPCLGLANRLLPGNFSTGHQLVRGAIFDCFFGKDA
jgi:hypothetical protein